MLCQNGCAFTIEETVQNADYKPTVIKDDGVTCEVACPLGYRTADDKYASVPKVRYPLDEVIVRI